MTKPASEFASKVFGAFTVLCALAQFMEYQTPFVRPLIATATGVCAIGFGIAYLRLRAHNRAYGELEKVAHLVAPGAEGLQVKAVENVAELRELWNLGYTYYGEDEIGYELFKSWWERYPEGIYLLKSDGEIIGEFEMWPLTSEAFELVLDGRKREREIRPEDIESTPRATGHQNWYIASVLLARRFRRQPSILMLLGHAMKQWLEEAASARHIRICALASSREGEALLRRFGFACYRRADETLDGWPSYLLETQDVDWVLSVARRLAGAGKHLRAKIRQSASSESRSLSHLPPLDQRLP